MCRPRARPQGNTRVEEYMKRANWERAYSRKGPPVSLSMHLTRFLRYCTAKRTHVSARDHELTLNPLSERGAVPSFHEQLAPLCQVQELPPFRRASSGRGRASVEARPAPAGPACKHRVAPGHSARAATAIAQPHNPAPCGQHLVGTRRRRGQASFRAARTHASTEAHTGAYIRACTRATPMPCPAHAHARARARRRPL